MDEQAAPEEGTLFQGVVDGDGGLGNEMLVVDIGGDANDALRLQIALGPRVTFKTGSVQNTCRLTAS